MKNTLIPLLMVLGAAMAAEAHPRGCDDRGPAGEQVAVPRRELREVRARGVVGYENRIVGYRDVMVDKQVTEYEMRSFPRRVFVGYDCHGPVYETRLVCERVPVVRIVQVCEKQPVYERCPIYEDVVTTRPVEVLEPVRGRGGYGNPASGSWGGRGWGWGRGRY